MEAVFFKYAFLALMGVAMLGVFAMATTIVVLGVKVVWAWVTTRAEAARTRHA